MMKNQDSLRSIRNIWALLSIVFFASCNQAEERLFELLPADKSGIQFANNLVETDDLNILDYLYFYNGGGLAMGDVNNDGLPDLFFTSNQNTNELYLNKGDLTFENSTEKAGVAGNSSWNTGAIMGDINGDGWLDIYVIAVVGINNFEGQNELFINNGDGTFTEAAAQFGLDFQSYGTTASLFDYDLDGDLDMYILNHAVHTEESFGKVNLREKRNAKTGDRLLRNDGDTFTDVSEMAGIYGGINGYGLGISISDFNKDGYPDIYVGNDFHEDDYYYLNQGDGTFKESLRDYFGHTSRFSMGNDVADINHDGIMDLISLDMAPEDETVLKSSEGDDTYQTLKMRTQQYGYHYQYTRNMLFTGNIDAPYTETGILNGVSATDWSWSALFGDYNQDGHQDLFVSNGIPKRPNDLDFIRFVSSEEIQKKMVESKLMDQQALEMMPDGAVPNYLYFGNGTGAFQDVSSIQLNNEPTVSGATAIGDLDGDGDLDIVTTNINAPASIYINNTNETSNYLKIQFDVPGKNPKGVGTKVSIFCNGTVQYKELFPNRGWQATSEPLLHFGLGKTSKIDSIQVIWPDQNFQLLTEVQVNQTLTIAPKNTRPYLFPKKNKTPLFKKVDGNLGINFVHKEDNHTDFNYQKLIPFEVSDRGPAVAIGDFNRDGKEDVFIGGAKNQPSKIFNQVDGYFEPRNALKLAQDSLHETVSATYLTDDGGSQFVNFIAAGGNVIAPSLKVLRNRLITEINDTIRTEDSFDTTFYNTSVIKSMYPAMDQTNEFTPLFVGNHSAPLDYGKIPPSYIIDQNGETKELKKLGMITDAIWHDFDSDGAIDLIVVGEWMQPKFLKNNLGSFEEVDLLENTASGLWQSILPFDIDHDGDMDYLLGNWGLNSKFRASAQKPMKMYYADFDDNGTTETIIAIEKEGSYYPLLGLNELADQLVMLRKKFNNYRDFAGKTIEEVLGTELLEKAAVYEVSTLASGFLRNTNNTFTFEKFSNELQTAPITAFTTYDFKGDGSQSVLAGGNYFGVIPFHGRFDSFSGALIHDETNIVLGNRLGLKMEHKSVRHLRILQTDNKPYLLIVYNNDAAEIYDFSN